MNIKAWLAEKARLEAIANDTSEWPMTRIHALTQLYTQHQFDVHNQARYVSQIRQIAEEHQ
jgi:hypothetical protein